MKKLKGLKGLGKLRGLRDLDGLLDDSPSVPDLSELQLAAGEFDAVSAREAELTNLLGDSNLAKKVLELEKGYGFSDTPYGSTGTLPELVSMALLTRKGVSWQYQVSLGAKNQRGTFMADFLLDRGGWGQVILVQGTYWHSRPGAKARDTLATLTFMGQQMAGLTVRVVSEVWEQDIINVSPAKRNRAFDAVLAGHSTR